MATNNSINFPNLTTKSTPTTSDSIELSDGGVAKQSTIANLPAINAQQVTQYSTSGLAEFTCSMPGMIGPTQSDSLTQTMGTLLNNFVVFVPFYVSSSYAMTKLYTIVKIGLAASTVTMGVYAATAANGGTFANLPTGAALAVGSVATTANNTIVNASVSTTLSPNTLYYAAIQASSAITLSLCVGILNFEPYPYSSSNIAQNAFVTSLLTYANTYSSGTLPTLTQSSLSTQVFPYCPIIAGV